MTPALKASAGWRLARWALLVAVLAMGAWFGFQAVAGDSDAPAWLNVVVPCVGALFCAAVFVYGFFVSPVKKTVERHSTSVVFLFQDRGGYANLDSAVQGLEQIAELATTPMSPLPFATPSDVWQDAWGSYQVEVLKALTDEGRPVAGGHHRGNRLIKAVTTWRGQRWTVHVRGAEALHAVAYAAREKGYTGFVEPKFDRSHEAQWAEHYIELGLLPVKEAA